MFVGFYVVFDYVVWVMLRVKVRNMVLVVLIIVVGVFFFYWSDIISFMFIIVICFDRVLWVYVF